MTHDNSLASFAEMDSEGLRAQVKELLRLHGKQTDRELATRMGSPERNKASPSVTFLIDAGEVEEVETVRCPETGKMVRVVNLADNPPRTKTTLRIVFENDNACDELALKKLSSNLLFVAQEMLPHLTSTARLTIKRGNKTSYDDIKPVSP